MNAFQTISEKPARVLNRATASERGSLSPCAEPLALSPCRVRNRAASCAGEGSLSSPSDALPGAFLASTHDGPDAAACEARAKGKTSEISL